MFRCLFLMLTLVVALAAEKPPATAAPVTPYQTLISQGQEAERKRLMGRAREAYEKAIELDPKRVDAYFYRAGIFALQRKREEAILDYTKVVELDPKASSAYHRRGLENFKLGNIEKSLEDFDRYIALEPQQAAYHWQRGIALYYAGKFEEGRKQFELHKTVNPDDVENGVWHFLCVARASSFEKARQSLMPIRGDRRVPMNEIYDLFAGKGTAEDVLKATKKGDPSEVQLDHRLFYAHLYLGLYYEAKGDAKAAYEHIKQAATEHPSDDYMGDVSVVHFKRLLGPPAK